MPAGQLQQPAGRRHARPAAEPLVGGQQQSAAPGVGHQRGARGVGGAFFHGWSGGQERYLQHQSFYKGSLDTLDTEDPYDGDTLAR